MGAAASTTSYTYKTAEEALAAGKTQTEIDVYMAGYTAGYTAGRAGKMEDGGAAQGGAAAAVPDASAWDRHCHG